MSPLKAATVFAISLTLANCSKFETKNMDTPTPPPSGSNTDPGPNPETGGAITLHWFGPDHPEDFDKFGGITGYNIHWSTSPKEATAATHILCGNILNEGGRPDDKYTTRVQVLGTFSGCVARAIRENVPGQPAYGTTTHAHECTYKVKGLPQGVPLYFVISPFMGDPAQLASQWWGCPTREFTLTVPAR